MAVPHWLLGVFDIHHSDEDVQRRGRNVIVLALSLIVLAGLFMPLALSQPGGALSLATAVVIAIGLAGVIGLARRGHVTAAALSIIVLLTGAMLLASLIGGRVGGVPFFLLVTILVAGITLTPWAVGLAVALNTTALAILAWRLGGAPQLPLALSEVFGYGGLLGGFGGLISALGAQSTARALRMAREGRMAAEQAASALDRANTALEQRTTALEQALAAQEAQAQALRQALATQAQLSATIAELTLPIIPVQADVLVIPLVGELDPARAAGLRERALKQIEVKRARAVILDITGVPLVDHAVAQTLLSTAQAARLLGARTLLVGVRPEVAQTLVALGVDLGILEPQATLQQGLEILADAWRNGDYSKVQKH